MKKKNILIRFAAILAFTVGLAACAAPASEASNSLEVIQKQGKLLIGTEGTYAPFTFHDQNGALTGFDVEIAEEIAERLGVKAEFIETKWDGMFAGLDSKRFDMIANQVGIRPDRQEKYDFSEPYTVSKAVLIVTKDNTDITSFKDLNGKKAAQSLTSNYADLARENGAEIVNSDGFSQSIDLLLAKRADATFNDSLSYYDLLKQKPDTQIKIAAEQSNASYSGMMFRKGNEELIIAVNEALAEMKADGTYEEISVKWFGVDISK